MKKCLSIILAVILCVSAFVVSIIPVNAGIFQDDDAVGAESYLWPVPANKSTSQNYSSSHKGIDIPGSTSYNIVATKSGTVYAVFTGCNNQDAQKNNRSCSSSTCSCNNLSSIGGLKICNYGYGRGVILQHSDGTYSCYAHMSSVSVSKGASVKQGAVLGKMGNYGYSSGVHLHFAVSTSYYYNYDVNTTPNTGIKYIYSTGDTYQDLGTGFYANIFSTANTNFAVAANDSNNVILANKSYIDNQKWLFERQSDKSYKITNAKSKLCMDVYGAYTADKTNIQVYQNNGNNAQRFYLVKDGAGYVLVPKIITTSAVDITGGKIADGTNIEIYKRNQSNAQRFTISKISNYNIAYNANGGTGTMASSTVAVNGKLTIAACGFTRSGYTFGGYNVYRSTDSAWYAAGVNQWLSNGVIMHSGYTKYHYNAGSTYYFVGAWTNGAANGCTYTFYPIWLPNNPKLIFYNNYSGCNYIRGSNLDKDYGTYFTDRSTDDIYTLSVDDTEKLNNQNSLKIESSAAGTSGQDMVFCTSTNIGRFSGSDGMLDYAGDNKNMTMSFWAKASTNGTKMYFRWGYQSEYRSVTLTTDWRFYTVQMNKNINCGRNMHPYIDTPGTVWLNDITLVDGALAAQDNFRMETESLPYEQAYVRGGKYTSLPQPERDGYTFLGWFTQANGGTQITTNTNVADYNTTVYAHWQKNNSDTPLAILMKGNKRFEIYDNDMTWEEAKEFCEAKGGHLPTINSSEENDMVASLIAGNCCTAWLGAKLNTDTENWEWITDEEFDYTNWAPGKPGGGANGLYAQMLSFDIGLDQTAGRWNDTANIHNIATLFSIENCMVICEYDLLLGDANNDGVVDIRDVTAIQRNAAETEFITGTSLYDADTDGNDVVDINDATVLQEYLAEFDVVMGRQ